MVLEYEDMRRRGELPARTAASPAPIRRLPVMKN
jgi:hypothetical protein